MVDFQGIFWYQPGTFQADLMIFVPRAVTLAVVICVYIRLFIFFQRRDLGILSSGEGTSSDATPETGTARDSFFALPILTGWKRRWSATTIPYSKPPENRQSLPLDLTPPAPQTTLPPPQPSSPTLIPLEPVFATRAVFVNLPTTTLSPKSSVGVDEMEFEDHHLSRRPDFQKRQSTPADHQAFALRPALTAPTSSHPQPKRLSPRQLNRRTSTLMMLYPLAYFLLFSVAVGRLSVQLATKKPIDPVLTDIARWLVYAQGLVDFGIYLFAEGLLRRSTRGRT